MRTIRIVSFAAALAFSVTPALALTGTFKTGVGNIIIWKNGKAMSEGISLISANVHKSSPQLVVPLVSCIVHAGDKFVPTDGGMFSSDVLIISGDESGCRGTVSNVYFDYDKESR